METVIILVVLLFVFVMAAWRWGADSTDGPESCEWERRRWRDEKKGAVL